MELNELCKTCKWRQQTFVGQLHYGGHNHDYCSAPRSTQCPVTNGSVLDFKDTDAVSQQEHYIPNRYCPECGKHTLAFIEVCESDSDAIKTSRSCDCCTNIVYIYEFKE
ncbi:hypothetical protein LCGC14_0316080 [marine sediment metagenome]|uniref:Uncharacterized protein n=1 Tax=marine sediment metagenome TaxID=412755 RepID=A0A0F9W7N3_9ZZZZ